VCECSASKEQCDFRCTCVDDVNFEKIAALRKQRGGYALHLSRKRDELKSLLDKGASVDRVQKRIVQDCATLQDLFDCNVKFIQLLESAGMPEDNLRSGRILASLLYSLTLVAR